MSVHWHTASLSLAINLFDIECHRAGGGLFDSRCVMNTYQTFSMIISVLSLSLHAGKRTSSQKSRLFFVFVSLLIATYFILNLIIEGTESNPASPYAGAHGIKKAVQGTFHQGYTWFGKTAGIQCTNNA